ncbi:hypothetical protein H4Q26_010903 [Puccinia striiformis f. sp. tritici PST-130]|nr:hypothetical protein H4Q26_010903 [Puccinia striiformis f. sp. tritici PST-130]
MSVSKSTLVFLAIVSGLVTAFGCDDKHGQQACQSSGDGEPYLDESLDGTIKLP